MLEKNQKIKDYIIQIANQVNYQYPELINDAKIGKVINMFFDSPLDYETIIKEINKLVNQAIQDYLEERTKRFDPELVKKTMKKYITN